MALPARAATWIRVLAVAAVAGALLWAAVPLQDAGFPAGHDMAAHITYTYLFDRAVAQGQFPVRWVQLVQDGRGQPLFNFYQPGLYYLVQVVHLAVPSLSLALKLTVVLLWWGGSAFMFLLCRPAGILAGAAAALLFGLSPYVLLDVFVRAAYPELAAIACAPGLLWSTSRFLATGRVAYLPVLAFLTCLMLISHLPSVLIFSPLFVAFIACVAPRAGVAPRHILALAVTALVGFAMAAFYVVPALGELGFVNIRALTTDYFDYRAHFVHPIQWVRYEWGYSGSVAGAGDGMSFQIGIVQWTVITLAGAAVLGALLGKMKGSASALVFWLGAIGVAMALMTEASAPVWEVVAPLRFVQFPWRFLMVVAVASGALAAALLSLVQSGPAQAVILLGAVALQIWTSADARGHERYVARGPMTIDYQAWADTSEGRALGFAEAGYYPAGVDEFPDPPVGRWSVRQGEAEVTEVLAKDHELVLRVRTDRGAQLAIHSPYFPGWRVRRNGVEAPVTRLPDSGYMVVNLAPGVHRVEAEFTDTPVRRSANAVSLAGLGAFVLLVGFSARRLT